MKARAAALLAAIALPALFLDYAGCTVWNDATVSAGGSTNSGGGGGGAGGVGGTGGADAGLSPGIIGLRDAAKICGMAGQCPPLAQSLMASLGLPIGRAVNRKVLITSQSECISWLAGPIPANRAMVGDAVKKQQDILEMVAGASDCQQAAALLPIEYIDSTDPRCGETRCSNDGTQAIICNKLDSTYVVTHCDRADFFGADATCNDDGQPRCSHEACTGTGIVMECVDDGVTFGSLCVTKSAHEIDLNCNYFGVQCYAGFCNNPDDTNVKTCKDLGAVHQDQDHHDELVFCNGVAEIKFDCSQIAPGATCVNDADADVGYRCGFSPQHCTPTGDAETGCQGPETLDACIDGEIVAIPCPMGTTCSGKSCTLSK